MAKVTSDADKVGHLLRRFSFGSSQRERAAYAGMNPDAVLEKLLTVDGKDSDVPPMRFAFVKDQEAQPGGYRFRMFWFHEMLTTQQPLREKAALFWHNHFACSENKTEDGLAMLKYMQALRRQPLGSFRDILKSMVTSVAVMKQLDVQMLSKANPNENLARELLELYTLGVGNYTEQDIKELAHVLTGHGYVDIFYQLGGNNDQRLVKMLKDETWGSVYCFMPDLHDDRPRTILGKEIRGLDEAVDMLAAHPQTAEFVCTKLWKFFGSPKVEPNAVKAMVKAWHKSGGVIGEVIREMAKTKEFWADEAVRTLPKNPIDFVVGIARAQGAGDELKTLFKPGLPNAPISGELEGALGEATYHALRIGFDLLYIPSVAGYDGGDAWISSEAMARKAEYNGIRMAESYQDKGQTKWRPAQNLRNVAEWVAKTSPKTIEDIAHQLNAFYDAGLNEKQLEVLAQAVKKHGDLNTLKNPEWMGWQMLECFKLIRLTPEYSLC
ncbi:MAG: DUF1800 family protein [Armatimonadota bacterium]